MANTSALRKYETPGISPLQRRVVMLMRNSGKKYGFITTKSGVCYSTLKNWETGKTRRPQVPTMNAVLKVLGYELDIVRR